MPIQGTAADMIKLAMIGLDRSLRTMKSRMLLQVHDELLFEVPERERENVERIVVRGMQDAMTLSIPIRVDVGFGRNWLEAH